MAAILRIRISRTGGERSMNAEERQRLNVRAIRVTLASALRHVAPERRQVCIDRAIELLAHVRNEATDPSVIAEVDALAVELRASGNVEREG